MRICLKKIKIVTVSVLATGLLFSCQSESYKIPKPKPSKNQSDSILKYLVQPVTETVIGNFKTITPKLFTKEDTLKVYGHIGFDQSALTTLSSRISGRIEKLYIEHTNQHIRKGQALMEIYSPELLTVQRNLLQAIEDRDKTLVSGLKKRLQNLGMTINEINQIIQTGKPITSITIYSPINGISRNPKMVGKNMQDNSQAIMLPIRKGEYINKGQTVFAIQSITKKWAILNIFNQDLGSIQEGASVRLYAEGKPEFVINGKIDFIPPFRDDSGKTSQIRVYLKNLPGSWKVGTLIRGEIAIGGNEKSFFIPLSAVNHLGHNHNVVWVQNQKHKKVFRAQNVKTGIRKGNYIQILSGINQDERIAKNASYMIGYESFVKH